MMGGGNPNLWWSMQQHPPSVNIPHHQQHHYHLLHAGSTSSTCSSSSSTDPPHPHHQSWTQLLLSGQEEKLGFSEVSQSGHGDDDYSHMMMGTVSSSASSSSSLMSSNINMLDFTYNKPPPHVAPDQNSSECNSRISRSSVGVCNSNNKNKKGSRVQQHLKVRKEKLGDRITALHQLVSPFGKTDTASVLMEAIGYIGFLHAQIQALTSPYLHNTNPQQHSLTDVQGVLETNCVFPEDPGQVLNNNEHGGLKRKGGPTSVHHEVEDSNNKDLFFFKTRGFCLLPISCIQHFGTPNAPDYCTSPFATGF